MLVQEWDAGGFCWYCNCGAPERATCWFAQNMWQSLLSLPASLSECVCVDVKSTLLRGKGGRKEGGRGERGSGQYLLQLHLALEQNHSRISAVVMKCKLVDTLHDCAKWGRDCATPTHSPTHSCIHSLTHSI